MNLNFNMPVQFITGADCVVKNAALFQGMGSKAMIVTGGSSAKRCGALEDVISALSSQGIDYILFDEVRQNPLLATCKKAGRIAAESGVDFLIGIGGGSPQDSTKAIAVFAANEIADEAIYLHDWKNPALPFALVGTTAGTASEVTKFSIMTMDNGRKRSFGCQQTYARYAFGDAKYTRSLPLSFTLSTTLDALAHAIEGYYSSAANAISDLFAIEAVRTLLAVQQELSVMTSADEITPAQREALYYGSILAGFSLNHCGTCYCHTIGYFLSEDYDIPHGFACAATLASFIERSEQCLPEKATALYERAYTNKEALLAVIEALMQCNLPQLSASEIDEITGRWDDSIPNFMKTPGAFTAAQAKTLVSGIFGSGCKL